MANNNADWRSQEARLNAFPQYRAGPRRALHPRTFR